MYVKRVNGKDLLNRHEVGMQAISTGHETARYEKLFREINPKWLIRTIFSIFFQLTCTRGTVFVVQYSWYSIRPPVSTHDFGDASVQAVKFGGSKGDLGRAQRAGAVAGATSLVPDSLALSFARYPYDKAKLEGVWTHPSSSTSLNGSP